MFCFIKDGSGISHNGPWADGTECDINSWCQRGKCVEKWKALFTQDRTFSEENYTDESAAVNLTFSKLIFICIMMINMI